jgi:uncharacterized SAM-binding protein YcdF (DUF218 family)
MKQSNFALFIIGLMAILLFSDITFIGAAIQETTNPTTPIFIIGLTLIMVALILQSTNNSLETILVPTGTPLAAKERTKTAIKEYKKETDKPYVLISGVLDRDESRKIKKDSQTYDIYKEFKKKSDIKPSEFIIEGKSKDTLENFLYSIKKLKDKNIEHVKIATNPTQYWRFKLFENEAKKEGLIKNSFEMTPLYTHETPKEFLYGVLAYAKDFLRIKTSKSLKDATSHHTKLGDKLKQSLEEK